MSQYSLLRRERLLTSSRPLPDFDVVAAGGPWLHLADGRRIFDGSSGLVCANVGQNSPKVLTRIEHQFRRATFAGAAVVRPHIQMELMERLCHAVGRPQDAVALVTCGTLGVEVAVGLARNIVRARGGKRRGDILTSSLSYHGNSALTLALAGNHARQPRPEDALGLGPAFPAPTRPPTTTARSSARATRRAPRRWRTRSTAGAPRTWPPSSWNPSTAPPAAPTCHPTDTCDRWRRSAASGTFSSSTTRS